MFEVPAQGGQLLGECADAAIPGRRIRPGRARIADGVGQAGEVGVGSGLRDDLRGTRGRAPRAVARARARRHSAVRSRAASRKRGPVSTRTAAAPAPGSATRRSIATTSATSSTASTGQADHFHGQPARPQCLGHRGGVGVAAHQHRGCRRRPIDGDGPVIARRQLIGHPIAFGHNVGQQRAPDRAGFGTRAWPQRPHRHRPPSRIGGHRIGHVQGARRVTPTGARFERGRGAAVGEWEVGAEPRQVRSRRATPAVDGLDRVADRGQRQPVVDPTTEQRRQRDPLRMPGVLVLVEQHHPVAVAEAHSPPGGTAPPAVPQRPSACRSPSPSPRAAWRAGRRSGAPARCARSACRACAADTGRARGRAGTAPAAGCARAAPARRGCRAAGRW